MIRLSAEFWIKHLNLSKHIEGGYFSEVYRSLVSFDKKALPKEFSGNRSASTHIYFLLEKGQFSAFHCIRSDELWHFYAGDPLIVYEIEQNGTLTKHLLGNDPQSGQSLFCIIKAGNWFASKVAEGSEYSLVGCTVSPGFDFADFELAEKDALIKKYPTHGEWIKMLS